jgi:hypothetical protein
VAAHTRRDRSVNTGDQAACFARRVATSTGEPYHALISQYKLLMSDKPLDRDRLLVEMKRFIEAESDPGIPVDAMIREGTAANEIPTLRPP